MKKYYLANTWYEAYAQGYKPQTIFTDEHPIIVVNRYNKEQLNYNTVLLSWQEITKEEYELAKSLDL